MFQANCNLNLLVSPSCVQDGPHWKQHRQALLLLSDTLVTAISRRWNPQGPAEDGAGSQVSMENLTATDHSLADQKKLKNTYHTGKVTSPKQQHQSPRQHAIGSSTEQSCHCPSSPASPISVFTTAPHGKPQSPNVCSGIFKQFVQGICSRWPISAFILFLKEKPDWIKSEKRNGPNSVSCFSSHCSESVHQIESKEEKTQHET